MTTSNSWGPRKSQTTRWQFFEDATYCINISGEDERITKPWKHAVDNKHVNLYFYLSRAIVIAVYGLGFKRLHSDATRIGDGEEDDHYNG